MKPPVRENPWNLLIFIFIAINIIGVHGFNVTGAAQPGQVMPPIVSFLLFSDDEPLQLITPYVSETDMDYIGSRFSTIKTGPPSDPPYHRVHDGLDIYPDGNLKPFQAVCSGRIIWMYTGDDLVIVMLACNSKYAVEYNFETQVPGTGQDQLDNINVVKGQTVSKGDIIGSLYAINDSAHVHFTLHENWIPICPEPHFTIEANNSVLNLLDEGHPAGMCHGDDPAPTPLVTPYVNASDITKIDPGFSSEYSTSPWGFVHDGFDIYPNGDLKKFRASCSGTVDTVLSHQPSPGSNWQVKVLIQCDDYVIDPDDGGYFIPFSVEYLFEPMSTNPLTGALQRGLIVVSEGDVVSQGDPVGALYAVGADAHVQFGVVQYGSSFFSSLGVPNLPICPEPHFDEAGRNSILNLLHVAWPNADMCYQN